MSWCPGQLIRSLAEPELGYGVVQAFQDKRLKVRFPDSERTYLADSAPIERIKMKLPCEALHNGEIVELTELRTSQGVYEYQSEFGWLKESEVTPVQNQGAVELFAEGHWSGHKEFLLRRSALKLWQRNNQSPCSGFLSARILPISHQLSVAQNMCNSQRIRACLADEVGLGKTIEAGLILSKLKFLSRASRVLILVPESLQVQWLVELRRRFHLDFRMIDQDQEAEEWSEESHAFSQNSHIISSTDFAIRDEICEEICSDDWDLIIADEAHHLADWALNDRDNWKKIERIFAKAEHRLLLTASVDLFGKDGEKALFSLIRNPDEEETDEGPSSWDLSNRDTWPAKARYFLRNRRVNLLIDSKRQSQAHPLKALPKTKKKLDELDLEKTEDMPALFVGFKPGAYEWLYREEKIIWLKDFLPTVGKEKLLIFCRHKARADYLYKWIANNFSSQVAVFHEGLDLVQRDKQAAWFADPDGAQFFVTSEIGGEGRNFQFASKLLLFDLPPHPEQVEQRIGRLDRIGQKNAVEVHVPYVEDSPEGLYFQYLNQAIHIFDEPLREGELSYKEAAPELFDALKNQQFLESDLRPLLKTLKGRHEERLNKKQAPLTQFVDKSSHDKELGKRLVREFSKLDADRYAKLFMDRCMEHFGVEHEEDASGKTESIRATAQMHIEHFPHLSFGEEKLISYDRDFSLAREDLHFLHEDHPMIQDCLELCLNSDLGKSAIFSCQSPLPEHLFWALIWDGEQLHETLFNREAQIQDRPPPKEEDLHGIDRERFRPQIPSFSEKIPPACRKVLQNYKSGAKMISLALLIKTK